MVEKKKKEERKAMVHIAFYPSEKEEIKKYAKANNFSTTSEFIRQTLFGKIRKTTISKTSDLSITPEQIKNIEKNAKLSIELQNLVLEKMEIIESMSHILTHISKSRGVDEIAKEPIIEALITELGELTPKRLSRLTKFDINEIIKIISNREKFALNLDTGGIFLK